MFICCLHKQIALKVTRHCKSRNHLRACGTFKCSNLKLTCLIKSSFNPGTFQNFRAQNSAIEKTTGHFGWKFFFPVLPLWLCSGFRGRAKLSVVTCLSWRASVKVRATLKGWGCAKVEWKGGGKVWRETLYKLQRTGGISHCQSFLPLLRIGVHEWKHTDVCVNGRHTLP